MMATQHWNQESDLIAALKSYTQADEDGVMVKVSRQACDEAVERIAQLERDLAAAQAERDTALTDTHDRIADLEAEAAALRKLLGSVTRQNIAFRWDGEKQCHVPWITVEFAAVPSGEPNTAQGWRDRDAFAAAIDQARGGGNG